MTGPEPAPEVLKAYGALPGANQVVEPPAPDGWWPRLVATDLDGTLLDSAGEVSPRTRAALTACWDAGIPVVGVTGRGPRLLDSVRAALAGRGIAVLAQGGYVVDLERDEVLRTVGLPRTEAAAVIAVTRPFCAYIDLARTRPPSVTSSKSFSILWVKCLSKNECSRGLRAIGANSDRW